MLMLALLISVCASFFYTKYWYSLGGSKAEAVLVFLALTLIFMGLANFVVR